MLLSLDDSPVMKVKFLLLLALPVLLGGCATQKLGYQPPAPDLRQTGASVVVSPLQDMRVNKSVDAAMNKGYLAEVDRAIVSELMSAGLFRSVELCSTNSGADLMMNVELHRLEWEVPKYDKKLGTAFMVGLTTGLVGGAIYSSMDTDVNGHAEVRIVQRAKRTEATTEEKTYVGLHATKKKNGVCDTPATKAEMIREALKAALAKMKADLQGR